MPEPPAGTSGADRPSEPGAQLRLRLFGRLSATHGDEPVRLACASTAAPLLAYLLLHRHEVLSRAHVAFTLWPDSTESDALAQLRRQLHVLQRALPSCDQSPWILSERATVEWNSDSDYWLDVEEFEVLCRADGGPDRHGASGPSHRRALRDVTRAVHLYTGDLLTEHYEDWILVERERLSRMYCDALTSLLGLQARLGDVRSAVATAERLVSYDPYCEEHHRLLVGLKYLAGDRAASLCALNECRRVMISEFGVAPMQETEQLGEVIRDSASPEQVVRLLLRDLPEAPGLAAAFRDRVPNNLPRPLTSFVGRERELGEVGELLRRRRLVTLSGPPGCGKSRLALEVGAAELARGASGGAGGSTGAGASDDEPEGVAEQERQGPMYPDGVWWLDCAALADPGQLTATLGEILRPRVGTADRPEEPLERHLRPLKLLLVLDNAEHMARECTLLVASLLRASKGVRVLATSRELLGCPGESNWPVPPLSVPPRESDAGRQALSGPGSAADPNEIARYDGVRLLVERAKDCAPEFELTPMNAGAVAEVCRRLDGNPLAIELAAARVRDLPISDVARRLEDRFRLLRRTGEPLEPHHRSLKAAIDWSYDFLPPKEQVLLRRLAVFRGGCTLEAAESICAGGEVAGDEVLDLVAGLVDKSLVEVSAGLGCRRYRVHAPVWHYAREKLAASGEERRVLSAHCDHYITVARAVGSDRDADYPPDSGSPLGEESRNLRAAMEWLGEDGSGGSEAELVLAAALRRLESGPTAP